MRRQPWPPHDHMANGRKRRFLGLLGALAAAFFAVAVVVLPCLLLAAAFERFFARQVTMPVFLLFAFLWSLAAYAVFRRLGRRRLRKLGHGDHDERRRPRNMFDETLEALDRIANGDYNIHVTKQGHYQYSELADKVNKLAKDLSSLEQMRQEFVSNVSHEIQSPLTSISGFATLLKKEDLSPEQRRHYLEVIESESKRLSGLSENLLRLSVLDSEQSALSPKPFRLDRQLEQVLLLLEPQWSGKGIELDVELSPATVEGDENLLGQVWVNLLHNAIKFTPENGVIAVAAQGQDGEVRCVVADTGSGIPEESLPRIFERFYKVDKARDRSLGGNGLGLSLVKKIVELHGGRVGVKSKVGEGTTFTVTLPARAE